MPHISSPSHHVGEIRQFRQQPHHAAVQFAGIMTPGTAPSLYPAFVVGRPQTLGTETLTMVPASGLDHITQVPPEE
jgi:hypothetical protein